MIIMIFASVILYSFLVAIIKGIKVLVVNSFFYSALYQNTKISSGTDVIDVTIEYQ